MILDEKGGAGDRNVPKNGFEILSKSQTLTALFRLSSPRGPSSGRIERSQTGCERSEIYARK